MGMSQAVGKRKKKSTAPRAPEQGRRKKKKKNRKTIIDAGPQPFLSHSKIDCCKDTIHRQRKVFLARCRNKPR